MKHIEHIQKLAVLHCVYQTIASADGGVDEERDKEAIALALKETGIDSIHILELRNLIRMIVLFMLPL